MEFITAQVLVAFVVGLVFGYGISLIRKSGR